MWLAVNLELCMAMMKLEMMLSDKEIDLTI